MSDKMVDQLISERDEAEEALSQAYFLVTGNSPEWSNVFGHGEALEEIDSCLRLLRADAKSFNAPAPTSPQQPTEAQGWSKEPWSVHKEGRMNYLAADNHLIAEISGAFTKGKEDDANAKRIVECVNAMEGVFPETLNLVNKSGFPFVKWMAEENQTMRKELQAANARIEKQNDEIGFLDLDLKTAKKATEEANARVKELEEIAHHCAIKLRRVAMHNVADKLEQLLQKGGEAK